MKNLNKALDVLLGRISKNLKANEFSRETVRLSEILRENSASRRFGGGLVAPIEP